MSKLHFVSVNRVIDVRGGLPAPISYSSVIRPSAGCAVANFALFGGRFFLHTYLDRIRDRSLEADATMRAIAERLGLGMATAAEPDIFAVEDHFVPFVIDQVTGPST